jgi:hypothetical protein
MLDFSNSLIERERESTLRKVLKRLRYPQEVMLTLREIVVTCPLS